MLSIRTKLCLNTHQAQFRRTSTLNLCTNLKEITLCTPYQIIIHVPEDSWNVEGEGWSLVDLHEPEPGPGCSSRHWARLATNHSRWLKVIFTFFKKISFSCFWDPRGVDFKNCFAPCANLSRFAPIFRALRQKIYASEKFLKIGRWLGCKWIELYDLRRASNFYEIDPWYD